MTNEPSITLAALQVILERETSVIAEEDVWLLMDQVRLAAGAQPTVADRVRDWGITATAEPIPGPPTWPDPDRGVQAWKVTLTREFFKVTVTVLTALGASEPTVADGLREVRRNAIMYGRVDRALTGTKISNPEADQYDRVMAWLGEPRFDALVYDTTDPND